MNRMRLGSILVGAVIWLFLLIQLIPFGHNHTNLPVVAELKWSSPQARSLVKEHCFQCHSNETQWPWYSNIAPASWLITMDVAGARREFNFSDWNRKPTGFYGMVEAIREGEMPPIQYWIFHPSAKMDTKQKQYLIKALQSSLHVINALQSSIL